MLHAKPTASTMRSAVTAREATWLGSAALHAVRSAAMEGREEGDPGYDDWFDEPEPLTATPTTQAPQQTLKPGDTGEQVKILQRALKALGFDPGKADGDYGPSTQAEVEKFQLSKQLAEDGIVGQQTLAALQQALSG